ncbi:MAG: hypothetical protein AAF208_10670 [Cyanobacteria bacterium P01_A01_bin.45]
MKKRRITYLLFIITLIFTLSLSYFWKRSPIAKCYNWAFSSVQEKYYLHPEKVVVKPWKGPHHVYGIFVIPGGHLNEKLFKVTISNSESNAQSNHTSNNKSNNKSNTNNYCGVLEFNGSKYGDFVAEPGYYIMRGLLNTRTALWLILQGKGKQLEKPQNWQVGYRKIENNRENNREE